jgi:hypothetical protein
MQLSICMGQSIIPQISIVLLTSELTRAHADPARGGDPESTVSQPRVTIAEYEEWYMQRCT